MLGRFVWSPWQLALMAAAGNGPLQAIGILAAAVCCASDQLLQRLVCGLLDCDISEAESSGSFQNNCYELKSKL